MGLRWLANAETPRLRNIEIETINRCNSDCSFCPVNRRADPRPLKRMTDALYARILDQLAAIDFAGTIRLYSNNEPLLDKFLVNKVALARQTCSAATIEILTNGTLLTTQLAVRLMEAGVGTLVVDNYADDLQLHSNIRALIDDLEQPRYAHLINRIKVRILKKTEVRSNRAGSAPNKPLDRYSTYVIYRDSACFLPFVQMIVRPDGKVSRCCQDALGQVTLGDLSESTIAEVWNGPAYQAMRAEMLSSARQQLPVCRGCDVPFVDPGLLHTWLRSKL